MISLTKEKSNFGDYNDIQLINPIENKDDNDSKGKEELGVKDLADMFANGLARVQDLGGAKPGDCTMVDTLLPFVESLKNAGTDDLKEALQQAAQKGFEGSESTRDMIPKLGRAKNLAERAIGYIDAGSRSMYYFLKGFADNAVV